MAVTAVFVGINRYQDSAIPELAGARRDALALWALFTDTIEGLAARRLVDEEATYSEVTDAILGALEGAQEDDVIVITFAGHGSPDGRLLLSDTDATNLPGTALPMSTLVDGFKGTGARAVLCILDCCFSGQAPARVFATDARPRNAFALDRVAGEGRILLAACATSEAAWEQPGTGHGLLTHATIEAFGAEAETVVDRDTSIIDVAFALARAGKSVARGRRGAGRVGTGRRRVPLVRGRRAGPSSRRSRHRRRSVHMADTQPQSRVQRRSQCRSGQSGRATPRR